MNGVKNKPFKKSEYLQKLMQMEESKINVAKVAFELSKEIDPTVNISAEMKQIRAIAAEVKRQTRDSLEQKKESGP